MSPGMDHYSSFQAHKSAVRQLHADQAGILSISSDTIRHHTRGGLLNFSYRHATQLLLWQPHASLVMIGAEDRADDD
jgi:hypothetical protein